MAVEGSARAPDRGEARAPSVVVPGGRMPPSWSTDRHPREMDNEDGVVYPVEGTEHYPLGKTLFTEDQIASRVKEVGEEINRDYRNMGLSEGEEQELVLVNVLKGAFIFLADLIRHLDLPLIVDFLAISSYGSGEEATGVRIVKDLSESIYKRHVLIVEDIVDTGLTLSYVLRNLRARGPRSIRVCTFLDRKVRRIVPLEVDYMCFEVGEEFVVGYGLDHLQKWRNLPFVCLLGEGDTRR